MKLQIFTALIEHKYGTNVYHAGTREELASKIYNEFVKDYFEEEVGRAPKENPTQKQIEKLNDEYFETVEGFESLEVVEGEFFAPNIDQIEEPRFPNGLTSYLETHFEVVSHLKIGVEQEGSALAEYYQKTGTGGLYELAKEYTDEFEQKNKGREWDGEFFDEIEAFVKEKADKL